MKIKAGLVKQAFETLDTLIKERRPLPSKAKFRLTNLFTSLEQYARSIEMSRVDLVKKYGYEIFDANKFSTGWEVHTEKIGEYQREWLVIAEDEIEVICQPIPLSFLESPALVEQDGKMVDPITMQEFLALGVFIAED